MPPVAGCGAPEDDLPCRGDGLAACAAARPPAGPAMPPPRGRILRGPMSRRRPSRWLAPLAILVIGAATLAIVNAGGSDGGGGATTTATERHASTTKKRTTRKVYVVRTGDTLSSISISTGVPVSRLQRLNPSVDVQALQPGQRLRLRS